MLGLDYINPMHDVSYGNVTMFNLVNTIIVVIFLGN